MTEDPEKKRNAVLNAIKAVRKRNADALKASRNRLEKLVSGDLTRQQVNHAAGALKKLLEEPLLEPAVEQAVTDAEELLERLHAEDGGTRLLDKLDEGARKLIAESLENLQATEQPEIPSLDHVIERLDNRSWQPWQNVWFSDEEAEDIYNEIIGKRGTAKRGRPRLSDDEKQPTDKTVRQVIADYEEKNGRFPILSHVIKEAGGDPKICIKRYKKIVQERLEAGGPNVMELGKLKRQVEADWEKAREEAKAKKAEAKKLRERLDGLEEELLKQYTRSTGGLPSTMMLPGTPLGGNNGEIRALRARIAELEAAGDTALRRAEELEAALRALDADADA